MMIGCPLLLLFLSVVVSVGQVTWPPVSSTSIPDLIDCSALGFTIKGRGYNFRLENSASNPNFDAGRAACKDLNNVSDLALLYDPVNRDLLYPKYINNSCYWSFTCFMIGLK
jgi:hypothetical protein